MLVVRCLGISLLFVFVQKMNWRGSNFSLLCQITNNKIYCRCTTSQNAGRTLNTMHNNSMTSKNHHRCQWKRVRFFKANHTHNSQLYYGNLALTAVQWMNGEGKKWSLFSAFVDLFRAHYIRSLNSHTEQNRTQCTRANNIL